MSTLGIVLVLGVSVSAANLLTPIAIRVARRTRFFDHPVGYKGHAAPTPYLGGAAVLTALLATAVPLGGTAGDAGTLLACTVAVWALGTLDDRHPIGPGVRVLAELALAGVLWFSGVGWDVFGSGVLGFAFTAVWVVATINAFNLMDNMDGAASTVAGVSFAAIGALALLHHATAPAVVALAMCGACLGFLPHNLAGPARIFLGDGGSMTLGFLVGGLALLASRSAVGGPSALLAAGLLAGAPLLDTTLVIISRRRRQVGILTAGRDHLTHRMLRYMGTPRRVALVLAGGQLSLVCVAIAASQLGAFALVGASGLMLLLGAATIAVFEGWTPAFPRPHPVVSELEVASLAGSVTASTSDV